MAETDIKSFQPGVNNNRILNFENQLSGYKVIVNYRQVPKILDFAQKLIILCSKTFHNSVVLLEFLDSDWEGVIFVGGVVLKTKGIPDSHKDFLVTLQALIE